MVYIDVHCHLDLYSESEIAAIIERARLAGVEMIVCNGVNPISNRRVLGICSKYDCVVAALGLYPIDALKLTEKRLNSEIEFIRKNADNIVAIGEAGIDLKETDNLKRQVEIFERIVRLALELDKPLIVHSRKAEAEVIEILERLGARKVVMHCFNGNFKLVKRIVGNGWLLTIPTNVKNSEHFQQIIAEVRIESLLCETDSPFLHPDKLRNNEPMNVVESYKKIAEIKGIDLKSVEENIEKNYIKFFNSVKDTLK